MKIIKNNHNNHNEEKEVITFGCTCPNCNSVLEINENDIQYDREDDEKYVVCPCCHMRITNEHFDRTVTLDNISYPFDFYKIGDNSFVDKVVHLTNADINEYIQKCIKFLKEYPDEPYKYIGTGDSLIIVFNHEDEYDFIVAKNYEESFVDKA